MVTSPLRLMLAAALALLFVAGCTTTASDGRYQTRGGGWDNFRAEALPLPATSLS